LKRSSKTVLIAAVCLLFALILLAFSIVPIANYVKLNNFEREISNIELPVGFEKVAIKGAIGDSGGNGDYSTLRVVMLIKTEFPEEELEERLGYYGIKKCESNIFESGNNVRINFKELDGIDSYDGYYFIEFISSAFNLWDKL